MILWKCRADGHIVQDAAKDLCVLFSPEYNATSFSGMEEPTEVRQILCDHGCHQRADSRKIRRGQEQPEQETCEILGWEEEHGQQKLVVS